MLGQDSPRTVFPRRISDRRTDPPIFSKMNVGQPTIPKKLRSMTPDQVDETLAEIREIPEIPEIPRAIHVAGMTGASPLHGQHQGLPDPTDLMIGFVNALEREAPSSSFAHRVPAVTPESSPSKRQQPAPDPDPSM